MYLYPIQMAARLCALAYLDDANVFEKYVPTVQHSTTHIYDRDTQTEAYVLEDAETIYVVFPGTEVDEGIADIRTDLRFNNRTQFHDMRLHRGFWEAWASISVQVAEEVYRRLYRDAAIADWERKTVTYCGHSLGGALAALGAATHNPQRCITFGQPHVGGKGFVKVINSKEVHYTRVVLAGDPVPSLLSWHPHYHHGGDLLFIDKRLNRHANPSRFARMRMRGVPSFYLDDHDMTAYQRATWVAA